MIQIIRVLFLILSMGVILGFIITVAWFCYAIIMNFYKIYLKKMSIEEQMEVESWERLTSNEKLGKIKNDDPSKVKTKKCKHSSFSFTDLNPDFPWTCRVCGKNLK